MNAFASRMPKLETRRRCRFIEEEENRVKWRHMIGCGCTGRRRTWRSQSREIDILN